MKFKLVMYKTSWVMLIVFIVLATVDFYSTLLIGDFVQYLEANFLYMLGVGFPVIILLNIFVLWYFLFLYSNKKNVTKQFYTLSMFMYFSLLRIVVIYNNFRVVKAINDGSLTVAIAQEVTMAAKISYVINMEITFLLLPVFISIVTYHIFKWEHTIESK